MNLFTNKRFVGTIAAVVTLSVAGIANAGVQTDFNKSGEVGLDDLQAFMSAYHNGSKTADVNGDGAVSIGDVFTFIQEWTTAYIKTPKNTKPEPIAKKQVVGKTSPIEGRK
jgi:hypothetical protein